MIFRYLIWDFDGTLYDTYPALIKAFVLALADEGIEGDPDEIAALLTVTSDHCVEVLTTRHALDPEAFEAQVVKHLRSIGIESRPPFPGAIRVCREFAAAGGINYIYTHRDRASLMRFLDWQHVTDLFADCYTRDDGYPRKPDATGFNALIEKHNLPRGEVLAVGDRDLDIQAGQGAGVRTCLYNAQPSPGVTPDYVIDTFEELEAILGLDSES